MNFSSGIPSPGPQTYSKGIWASTWNPSGPEVPWVKTLRLFEYREAVTPPSSFISGKEEDRYTPNSQWGKKIKTKKLLLRRCSQTSSASHQSRSRKQMQGESKKYIQTASQGRARKARRASSSHCMLGQQGPRPVGWDS